MSQIPEKLTNFRVYGGPKLDVFLGVADVDLPKFEAMSETISGAGIAGEFDSPTLGHLKAMSVKLKMRTATPQTLKLAVGSIQQFDIRAAEQTQDSASTALVTRALRVETRGPIKMINPGKVEPGKPMDAEIEQSISVIRIFSDGAPVIEFDALNFIYKVDGVDYLAAQRVAMGG